MWAAGRPSRNAPTALASCSLTGGGSVICGAHAVSGGGQRFDATVSAVDSGARLDQWLAARLPDVSRTRIRRLIDDGVVHVDGIATKAAHRLRAGERIAAELPPPPPDGMIAEP